MQVPVAVAVVSWNTRDLLDTCLSSMRDDAARGEALEEHDRAFHRAILEAAHNPALDRLGSVLDEFFRVAFREKLYESVEALQNDLDKSFRQ